MSKRGFIVIYFIIALVSDIVAMSGSVSVDSLTHVGYASTAILLSFLFADYKINRSFSYSSVFILVLFLFHFGQLVLLTYFVNIYSHVRILLLLDVKEALYGFRMMTLALSTLCMGILVKSSSRPLVNTLKYKGVDWARISKKIIVATFPVKLALDTITLVISIVNGGDAARLFVNSFPNVFLFYGKISLLGFGLLLVVLKKQPQKQKKLFIGMIAYILIMMISGIRSENVGYIAVFVFLYLRSRIEPIKIKQTVLYGVLGVFLLTFIVAVGQFRSYTNKSLDSLWALSGELLTEENVILGLFDTCGDTGYTAQEVLNSWLPKYGPTYGDAYYKGVAAIIPNFFPFVIDFGKITEESSCPIKLQKSGSLESGYDNIGGSFFGEVFMNFGVIGGIIACFFFGLFFGWVGSRSSLALKMDNYYELIIFIPLMLATIYWVRSYFGGGIREAVWDIIFGLIVLKNSYKKQGRLTL